MSFARSDIQPCARCGRGIAHAGPVFYRVAVEQMVIDAVAVQREAGLEAMVGNAAIAAALSPNADFAHVFRHREVLLCGACGIDPTVIAVLLDDEKSA